MDIQFLLNYAPHYVAAAKLTLALSFYGILLSLIIGFMCNMIRLLNIPVLSKPVIAYIEISRNTPLLIQLFFLYYGLPKMGILLSSKACAIIGLSFLGGSYMAEAFRGGFEAISHSQTEVGLSIGLSRLQIIRYILLPQALTISLPQLGANIIFLIKETSLFSAVALADLMFVAKDLIGLYYKTTESLFMLVSSYFIILLPLTLILNFIERRIRYAGYGV